MPRGLWILIVTIAFWSVAASGFAADKVALVIGIDDYDNIPHLTKAVGDAEAISNRFGELGFKVTNLENPGRRQILKALSDLRDTASNTATIVLHFSGHGVAIDGENFILPKDVSKPGLDKQLLRDESISQSQLIQGLVAGAAQGRQLILIIDACRDNPYSNSTRSVGMERGLARVEPPRGVFILYSAGFGQTALDRLNEADEEKTSVYTRVLLKQLSRPGANLIDIANDTRHAVEQLAAAVNHQQSPASYDQLDGRKVVLLPAASGSAPVEQEDLSEAAAAFNAAKAVGTVEALDAYIKAYPDTFFTTLARTMRDDLARKEKAEKPKQVEQARTGSSDDKACNVAPGPWRVSGVAGNDTLNVRSGPGTNYSVVMRLAPNATGIRRETCSGDGRWCRISHDCRSGWVAARFLSNGSDSVATPFHAVVGVASNDTLNIRANPNSSAREIARIPYNARDVSVFECIKVSGYISRWCRVSWQGASGWAYSKFLTPAGN